MNVRLSEEQNSSVIFIEGKFDFKVHSKFTELTKEILKSTSKKEIIVDLSRATYIDSGALGMLLILRDRAKAVSRKTSLKHAHGPVLLVLQIAKFEKLFEFK